MVTREEFLEKRLDDRDVVWERLRGKRIVVAGAGGEARERVLRNLAEMGSRGERGFLVETDLDKVERGDFVLLFAGRGGEDGRRGESEGVDREYGGGESGKKSWERGLGSWEETRENWDEVLSLVERMERLRLREPEAVLLVTGSEVYGKWFGEPRPLGEEELGYVCHTSRQDSVGQCMRTAEHFACRLAKEGLPVKVARLEGLPSGEGLPEVLEAVVSVLTAGRNGEVYNIPEPGKTGDSAHSPLRPAAVRMDGGKTERLKHI